MSSSGAVAWLTIVTLSLLVVLAAIVLRFYRRGTALGSPESGIEILAIQPLGPREQIVVVRIEGRVFALGHTAAQVSLISELDDFSPKISASQAWPQGFAGQLQRALSKGVRKP